MGLTKTHLCSTNCCCKHLYEVKTAVMQQYLGRRPYSWCFIAMRVLLSSPLLQFTCYIQVGPMHSCCVDPICQTEETREDIWIGLLGSAGSVPLLEESKTADLRGTPPAVSLVALYNLPLNSRTESVVLKLKGGSAQDISSVVWKKLYHSYSVWGVTIGRYRACCRQAAPTTLLISWEQDTEFLWTLMSGNQVDKVLVRKTPEQGKNTVVKCHRQVKMSDTSRERTVINSVLPSFRQSW